MKKVFLLLICISCMAGCGSSDDSNSETGTLTQNEKKALIKLQNVNLSKK